MKDIQPIPTWHPTPDSITKTHLFQWMQKLNFENYLDFQRWSYENYSDFWNLIIQELNIVFDKPYQSIVDLSDGLENPHWLPGSQLNIINTCFKAPSNKTAIYYQGEQNELKTLTYQQLEQLTNQIANGLNQLGYKKGDTVALVLPFTPECVASYLGIIKAGCIAVSIAESFSSEEIKTRLHITNCKIVITQNTLLRSNKRLPLYEKVIAANPEKIIVIRDELDPLACVLRDSDLNWHNFLSPKQDFKAITCFPNHPLNILFSSGTTGEPKAIPWDHTTPIKCASDAYWHHDIHNNDILSWPTSIGWMMGPWLIFAALINQASLAIYNGAATEKRFGEFIANSKVTMLGVVPSLVKQWRLTKCMENLNWSALRLFSSTAECSNPNDMQYLMNLAGNKPIIEYCGGTEIGGAYITGTLVQPCAPAAFTTPAMGIHFLLLDENGKPANKGEVALIPPSIGLSTQLLNHDHHEVYYDNMPTDANKELLRRHGDEIEYFPNGFYRALGRVDDTMKLGGIKVSAAEIERLLQTLPEVNEVAAIAVPPTDGGPSQLVIYAVLNPEKNVKIEDLKAKMQQCIREGLNPLFKINDLVMIDSLPRTASNKVMRRILREQY